jgi:deoxyxylulose-5-phosphate synthase
MRIHPNAKTAILALGAPAYLAASAREKATAAGVPTDVYVVNGFPLDEDFLSGLASRYTRVVTIEDGLIGTPASGLQGFAGLAASSLASAGVSLHHFGIVDPTVAPSETFVEVWEHFGISEKHLLEALLQKD